ncbi:MptD family putative ECF transporter S component [Enterococcus sp. BWB1-3]|uniref:MptD family putative ECF transporter S component n=1 Tax=unclassified Enterococcus TaxID=2608891 RepID=UPI001922FFB0|nr:MULTISPECIES: MptD family putative ECF transporter S component [unclassified Enterococcus]MBL1230614.1 MptD family putative ECF transporter S component [Enterococcus sp. BWB1-3]MCB5955560.1 MptD family putative ECF transporter S component [Enterococcus sp. CWB-B31]
MKKKTTASLASKDYLTIGLYTLVQFVIVMTLSMVTVPFLLWLYPYATAFVLFFTCPIYLLIAFKVGKKGTLLIFGAVNGLFYAIMGTIYVLPFTLIGALIGEFILAKTKGYRKLTAQTAAFTIYNLFYGFSNYIILAISADYYFSTMQIEGILLEAYTKYMITPFWIFISIMALIMAISLGCLFGYHLLRKHFIKAGIISPVN